MKNTHRSIAVLIAAGLFGTAVSAQPNKSPSPQPALAVKLQAQGTSTANDSACKIGPDYQATVSKRPPFRRITSCETVAVASNKTEAASR